MAYISTFPTQVKTNSIRSKNTPTIKFVGHRLSNALATGISPSNDQGKRTIGLEIYQATNGNFLAVITYITDNGSEWGREKVTVIPEGGAQMPSIGALMDYLKNVDPIDLSNLMPYGARPDDDDPIQADVAHVDGLWQELRDGTASALGVAQVNP